MLEIGDPAPLFTLVDQWGNEVFLGADTIAGDPTVLVFCPQGANKTSDEVVSRYRALGQQFGTMGARVFVINRESMDTPQAAVDDANTLRVLADVPGAVFDAYGIEKAAGIGAPCPVTSVLVNPNAQIAWTTGSEDPSDHVESVLERAGPLAHRSNPVSSGPHPPIMIIPNVLSDTACDILIEAWKRPTPVWGREALGSDALKLEKSDYKIETDTDAGKLTQHHILDPEINGIVDKAFIRRIIPQLYKAYRYKITQHEQYKILRYLAADGGFLGPHRDNSTPETAHRHFTMTMNLVADGFDGGELRFPEYGGHLYRGGKGSAVVWSATLLHEVTALTSGERFVLGTHLF